MRKYKTVIVVVKIDQNSKKSKLMLCHMRGEIKAREILWFE